MKIAYTVVSGRGQTDPLLAEVAEIAIGHGVKCIGSVQYNSLADLRVCDMDLKVLPDGPVLRISESRGVEARGCRLDPSALEMAVGLTVKSFDTKPDLLIVNKFGKHEAAGRGFRPVIADALEKGIPVLVGVNELNKEAFIEFTSAYGQLLEPNVNAILDWVVESTGQNANAA